MLNAVVDAILKSGGWCKLNFATSRFSESAYGGRIVHQGDDFIVFQPFNIEGDFWDGVYIVPEKNFKYIRKALWVRKYLTVGGKMIDAPLIPHGVRQRSWFETLNYLQRSLEPSMIGLSSGEEVYGYIQTVSPNEIRLKSIMLGNVHRDYVIESGEIRFLGIELKRIREVYKAYKRWLF